MFHNSHTLLNLTDQLWFPKSQRVNVRTDKPYKHYTWASLTFIRQIYSPRSYDRKHRTFVGFFFSCHSILNQSFSNSWMQTRLVCAWAPLCQSAALRNLLWRRQVLFWHTPRYWQMWTLLQQPHAQAYTMMQCPDRRNGMYSCMGTRAVNK